MTSSLAILALLQVATTSPKPYFEAIQHGLSHQSVPQPNLVSRIQGLLKDAKLQFVEVQVGAVRGRSDLAIGFIRAGSFPDDGWFTFTLSSKQGVVLLLPLQIVGPKSSDTDQWVQWGDAAWSDGRLIIAGWANCGGNWDRPNVCVYAPKRGGWTQTQNFLGADEDAGTSFAKTPRTVHVVQRSYPKWLNQPHAGPLLLSERWLTWNGRTYSEGRTVPIKTPLAALDRLAKFVDQGARKSFDKEVPPKLRSSIWHSLAAAKDDRYAGCTKSDYSDKSAKLIVGEPRLLLTFANKSGHWRVVSATRAKE